MPALRLEIHSASASIPKAKKQKFTYPDQMRPPRSKRILWIIALFVALSVFAGMILRKHAEPKIIGEISPEDVSDVSKVAVDFERDSTRRAIQLDFRGWYFKDFFQEVLWYPSIRVTAVEGIDTDDVVVRLGAAQSKLQAEYLLEREGSCWKVTSTAVHAVH